MTVQEIQVDVIGLAIEASLLDRGVEIPVSGAGTLTLRIQKPSGVSIDQTATFISDADGERVRYLTIDGDIDEAGLYQLAVYMIKGSWSGFSSIGKLFANANLTEPSI